MIPAPTAGEIAESHARLVRLYFRRRCQHPEDAEDLAQEAFCAILRGWHRFGGRSAASTWVYAVCRNVYSHWARQRSHAPPVSVNVDPDLIPSPEPAPPGFEPSWPGLLARLTPRQKRLFEAYYRQGESVRSIAVALSCPEGTVKYHLSQLRQRLRVLLLARATR